MKKMLILVLAFLGMAMTPGYYKAEKLTLKERIDQNKVIKVYFSTIDIKHNPNTVSNGLTKATGCAAFTETTLVPEEYLNTVKQLVNKLNEGFSTTAFVEGDYAALPLVSSGIAKGSPDWAATGEPLSVLITTWGNYNVTTTGMPSINASTKLDLDNSLSMDAYFAFYGLVDGKVKILEQKSLFSKATASIKSTECKDYAFFTQNFPANSLADEFRTVVSEKMNDFIVKEMANYEKAMKKKNM